MTINSRSKGKRGEREILNIIQAAINEAYEASGYQPPQLQRNTLQSDRGGYDIVGLPWLALEVKRVETPPADAWWEQARSQAKPGQVPVLVYRRSNTRWRARLVGLLMVTDQRALQALADVTLETLLRWIQLRCCADIETLDSRCAGNA